MAKRKRLTPAKSEFLSPTSGLETKSTTMSPAPIAQVASEASATAALSEVTQVLDLARSTGRLIQVLSLEDIDTAYLVRDRIVTESDDLESLVSSLRVRGQQTAIEVVDYGNDHVPRYGLISGWRRVAALKILAKEDDKFGKIQALIRVPENASDAYIAMVEENEIRVGLSFYERARIVVKSMDAGVYTDLKAALQGLYQNVPRAKRSKIKSFVTIVQVLDGELRFPSHIGEKFGLQLARFCQEYGGQEIVDVLRDVRPDTASEELDVLRRAMTITSPKPNAAEVATFQSVKFNLKASRITISGADEEMFRALQKWLAAR